AIKELAAVANSAVETLPEEAMLVDSQDDPPAFASWELRSALLGASRYSEAADASRHALDVVSKSTLLKDGLDFLMGELNLDLGYALLELGQYDEASRALRIAAEGLNRSLNEQHPDHGWLRAYEGLLMIEQGRVESAIAHLERELAKCATRDCGR